MNINYNNLLVKANLIAWLKGIASAENNTFMKQTAGELSTAITDNGIIANKPYYNDFFKKYQTKITGQSGVYSIFSLISGTQKAIGQVKLSSGSGNSVTPTPTPAPTPTYDPVTFAMLGDSGQAGLLTDTRNVANEIQLRSPDFVLHLGDANYGNASTVSSYFLNYWSSNYINNAMYLAFGNHDLDYDYGSTLLDNLPLVNNAIGSLKRSQNLLCYDFVRGPIHFFVLNSGNTASGDTLNAAADPNIQLQTQLNEMTFKISDSAYPWNILVVHKPPYSSESAHRLGSEQLRFNYNALGVDIVLSAHSHDYEYIYNAPTHYFVQGLGGATKRCAIDPRTPGAVTDYCAQNGYTMVEATSTQIVFKTYNTSGTLIDTRTITK
jgi:hypothetical protein